MGSYFFKNLPLAIAHASQNKTCGACKTFMGKTGKGNEVLSGHRRTETVYVWSKRGRGRVLRCTSILKELNLSGSGCDLVVNSCGNGNISSGFVKYVKCLTKEGNINLVRKRPLPKVGYDNLLCPSARIRIIIKCCNLFEVYKETFWR